jgi:hypothetical protein
MFGSTGPQMMKTQDTLLSLTGSLVQNHDRLCLQQVYVKICVEYHRKVAVNHPQNFKFDVKQLIVINR